MKDEVVIDSKQMVLVGSYKDRQLAWIKKNGIYNYPVKDGDEFNVDAFAKIKELWLYANTKGIRYCFEAEFLQKMTQAEFLAIYPTCAKFCNPKSKLYYVFKTSFLDGGPKLGNPIVLARGVDFGKCSVKQKKSITLFKAGGEFSLLAKYFPYNILQVPRENLRICDSCIRMSVWSPVRGLTPQQEKIKSIVSSIAEFGRVHSMSVAGAYQYLKNYAGLDFLDKYYSISRCYSDEMMDESLLKVCRNNGGSLK